MESMELFAKIAVIARAIGNVNTISEPNVKKLLKLRSDWGMDTENFSGCKVGNKMMNYDNINSSPNSMSFDNKDNEKITLTKKELVEIVEYILYVIEGIRIARDVLMQDKFLYICLACKEKPD